MEDKEKLLLVLTGLFVVLISADLITDFLGGGTGPHLILEGLLLGVSGTMFIAGLKQLTRARQEIRSLQGDVEKLQIEKDKWKGETQQLLAGLSVKIEDQFKRWNLTQAEMEVGFLLLKGFSLKEIADVRDTKLKTTQQQSQAIYQKTGLGSRSELAAFFLEDLLPPSEPQSR